MTERLCIFFPGENGTTKTYYHDGSIYEVKNWLDGILDGVWKIFFVDGSLQMESAFKDGLRDGKQISYHPNGKVYYNGSYIADKKSGEWEYFTTEGKTDTIINYNE